ncbi:hypothetical protein D3C76_1651270 [compost metagenome]
MRILLYMSCIGGHEPMMPISPLAGAVPLSAGAALPLVARGSATGAAAGAFCRSRRMRATACSISSWSKGLAM